MLFLVLLLALLPLLNVSATINLTYILKRDGSVIEPSCVAEELERYAAVGWVYPIPEDEEGIPNTTTKFVPTIQNDYNCKFSKNDLCSKRWSIKDWYIDESSKFLGDTRWEDLPTIFISNTTNEVKERIEVQNVFRSGISVRAGGIIELFVCNGWNPHSYPCYYFHVNRTEIYLNKYSMLPKDLNTEFKNSYLKHYKAFSSILSHDEWRNFEISLDENHTLTLFDVNLNRTVIEYTDGDPLAPTYLLMRSSNASLWKIHRNEFLYTNTTQISRLGPQLTIINKDLCVSLLVSTCDNCEMSFFYQNGAMRKVLKYVGPMKDEAWIEVKLKEENILVEKVHLFVETKFKDEPVNKTTGFWAVDSVRVCNENEVKLSFLKLNDVINEKEASEEYISCQLIQKPSWRPKQLTYDKITDFPEVDVTRNSTSIKLSWTQEDPMNQISYFVSYQGNDICASEPHSLKRVKSNGFLSTKLNELVIDGLVPFTLYNITFSTVLHEKDKVLYVNTLETVEPAFEELPKIQVIPTDSAVFVAWSPVNCTNKYGRLIYSLVVSDKKSNVVKKLEFQTETSYKIEGLQPYTSYILNVTTARSAANINNNLHSSYIVLHFSTLAGEAPPVENLELYSIDQNSASLRYDLPKDPKGVPSDVQVTRCNALSFKKCKTYTSKIKRCPLWPKKYCVFINNLLEYQSMYFSVALKNLNTKNFGKAVSVHGYTVERVPGAPTNLSYKIVDCHISTDYCHLNITWFHPYDENGTITYFNIDLNSTSIHKHSEEDKYIRGVYKVENKTYLPQYTHQIRFVPYSASYDLRLQSANMLYRSNYTSLTIKTDNIGDHIDQSPKLLGSSDSTLVFQLPHLDRRLDFYTLTVVVQDFDRNASVAPRILDNKNISEYLCHRYGDTWISQVVKVKNNDTEKIMIGKSEKDRIKPKTKYCITFIITNRYKESEHVVVYYEKLETPDAPPSTKQANSSSPYNHLYILLVLLLLVPIGFLIYRYLRKRRVIKTPPENNENVYESMPFDDCDTNCVSNENYDKLLHN